MTLASGRGAVRAPKNKFSRALGVGSTLIFPCLWASGAFGDALSWQVTSATTLTLAALCVLVPAQRLSATLKIMMLVASTSMALCGADLLLRVFGERLVYYRAHSELVRRDVHYPGLSHYVPNARSERLTFGDLAAMSGDPRHRASRNEIFQTDERGFRNSPNALSSPVKLVIVGDSFGMGLGSSQDETWASLLEKEGRPLYNLSMPATCPMHGAARLSLTIKSLHLSEGATIVVPLYIGNDLEECAEAAEQNISGRRVSGWRSLRIALQDYRSRSPLRQLGMRLIYRWVFADPVVSVSELPDGKQMLFYKPHTQAANLSVATVEQEPNFQRLTSSLKSIHALASENRASTLVVIIPTKEEIYGWILREEPLENDLSQSSGLARAVQSFCDSEKIPWIDLRPALAEEAKTIWEKGELLWWTDDSHWNSQGHQTAARLISQALETK